MAQQKQTKRKRDIKTKLMAAICMLLVSSIMMVSTTYAWFTLSTAPEVTGINTAVGANGNLEMALVPTSGVLDDITSTATDGNKNWVEKNVTWGNLVDLSDVSYGLDQITLYPSALNTEAEGTISNSPLKFPTYGVDGRVNGLSTSTTTAVYDAIKNGFLPNATTAYGVRAVGTSSSMTPRMLAFRNSQQAASTATRQATLDANRSLEDNGEALANIAIKKALNSDVAYSKDDLTPLVTVIDDLIDDGGILESVEKAYLHYIKALLASDLNKTAPDVYATINPETDDLATVVKTLTDNITSGLPEKLSEAVAKLTATKNNAATAKEQLNEMLADMEDTATKTWDDIDEIVKVLFDINQVTVNDIALSAGRDALTNALMDDVMAQKGVWLNMPTGSGVYADIADHCGDYYADVLLEGPIETGISALPTLSNISIKMYAKSTTESHTDQNTNRVTYTANEFTYLKVLGAFTAEQDSTSGSSDEVMPISTQYGYILDLAFRTNAAGSSLLLQTEGIDRIYDQETGVEMAGSKEGETVTTMGKGSTMSFSSTATGFNTDMIKALMGNLKLVFFDEENNILAYADLNMATATVLNGIVEADIQLYVEEVSISYKTATADQIADSKVEVYTQNGEEYTKHEGERAEGTEYYVVDTVSKNKTYKSGTDAVIKALDQNVATRVSVLVYLDGKTVQNADVAVDATSMTGTLNLQFASTATLDPMDYSDLMSDGGNSESESTETTAPTPSESTLEAGG